MSITGKSIGIGVRTHVWLGTDMAGGPPATTDAMNTIYAYFERISEPGRFEELAEVYA